MKLVPVAISIHTYCAYIYIYSYIRPLYVPEQCRIYNMIPADGHLAVALLLFMHRHNILCILLIMGRSLLNGSAELSTAFLYTNLCSSDRMLYKKNQKTVSPVYTYDYIIVLLIIVNNRISTIFSLWGGGIGVHNVRNKAIVVSISVFAHFLLSVILFYTIVSKGSR